MIDGVTYKLRLLPSGIVRKGKISILGNGVVIDPWALLDEIAEIKKKGIDVTPENFMISESASLILPFHQEMDEIRGGYHVDEAFRGQLTEMNIWDIVLEDKEIDEMSKCNINPHGNVVSWERDKWVINTAIVSNMIDISSLCKEDTKLVMFTSYRTIKQAGSLSSVLGRKILTPHTQDENDKLYSLSMKYNDKCLDEKTR